MSGPSLVRCTWDVCADIACRVITVTDMNICAAVHGILAVGLSLHALLLITNFIIIILLLLLLPTSVLGGAGIQVVKHAEEASEDDTNGLWNGQTFKPLPAVDVPDLPAGCARATSLQVRAWQYSTSFWYHICLFLLTLLCYSLCVLCDKVGAAVVASLHVSKQEVALLHALGLDCWCTVWYARRAGSVAHMAQAWATPPTRVSGSQRSPPRPPQRRCWPCLSPQDPAGGVRWGAPPRGITSCLLAPSRQGGMGLAECQRRSSRRLIKSHILRMSRLR